MISIPVLDKVNTATSVISLTTKGNTVYVHVLDPGDGVIEIKDYMPKIKSALLFDDGSKVQVKKGDTGMVLSIPVEKIKPIDTIVVLTLR